MVLTIEYSYIRWIRDNDATFQCNLGDTTADRGYFSVALGSPGGGHLPSPRTSHL